jgi:hypothetical protein
MFREFRTCEISAVARHPDRLASSDHVPEERFVPTVTAGVSNNGRTHAFNPQPLVGLPGLICRRTGQQR